MLRLLVYVLVSLALLFLTGCDASGLKPVTGVVMFDGQPLAKASIQFIPQGQGRDATGSTNERGEFVMSTSDPQDGVMPGTYKVVITPPLITAPPQHFASSADAMLAPTAPPKSAVPNFPVKYTKADQSPLTQEVPVKDKKVTFDLMSE